MLVLCSHSHQCPAHCPLLSSVVCLMLVLKLQVSWGQSNLLICPCSPIAAVAAYVSKLPGPLQNQAAPGLAEDVAKEGPVALGGTAGDMGTQKPPSCCCQVGEVWVHADEPKGTARACVTDHHLPILKCGALIQSFTHISRAQTPCAASQTLPSLLSLLPPLSKSICQNLKHTENAQETEHLSSLDLCS